MDYSDYFSDPESVLGYNIETAKPIVRLLTCHIHRRKARVTFDYDDRGQIAHVSKYCCQDFAEEVADKLAKLEIFDYIEIGHLKTED